MPIMRYEFHRIQPQPYMIARSSKDDNMGDNVVENHPKKTEAPPPPATQPVPKVEASRRYYKTISPADYGFRSQNRLALQQEEQAGQIPGNLLDLARANFKRELRGLRCSVRFPDRVEMRSQLRQGIFVDVLWALHLVFSGVVSSLDAALESAKLLPPLKKETDEVDPEAEAAANVARGIRRKLRKLTLDGGAIWDREHAREDALREKVSALPHPHPNFANPHPHPNSNPSPNPTFDNPDPHPFPRRHGQGRRCGRCRWW